MAKLKYGKVEIPAEDFKDENMSAHISMRLPLDLLNDLRALSLTPDHGGRYQVLMRDILTDWVKSQKTTKRKRA